MYMYMLCVLSCAYSQLGMANTLSKDHWLVHWPLTFFSVLHGHSAYLLERPTTTSIKCTCISCECPHYSTLYTWLMSVTLTYCWKGEEGPCPQYSSAAVWGWKLWEAWLQGALKISAGGLGWLPV